MLPKGEREGKKRTRIRLFVRFFRYTFHQALVGKGNLYRLLWLLLAQRKKILQMTNCYEEIHKNYLCLFCVRSEIHLWNRAENWVVLKRTFLVCWFCDFGPYALEIAKPAHLTCFMSMGSWPLIPVYIWWCCRVVYWKLQMFTRKKKKSRIDEKSSRSKLKLFSTSSRN